MAVIRCDILSDAAARDAYVRGVKLLKQEVLQPGGPSTYDVFVIWHHRAMMTLTPADNAQGRNAAHMGPVFLPWHRYVMIVLEKQLQRVLNDGTFGLPYWNWGADGDMAPAQQRQSRLWADECMGGGGKPVASGPFKYDETYDATWRVKYESGAGAQLRATNRGMIRSFDSSVVLPTRAAAKAVVGMLPYDKPGWDGESDAFRNWLEGWQPGPGPTLHNVVHVWIGGDMGAGTSPNDPVFYLNHANVDRIWAAWQQRHGKPPYVPDGAGSIDLKGHRLNDSLYSVFANPPSVADMLDVSEVYTYDTLADLL